MLTDVKLWLKPHVPIVDPCDIRFAFEGERVSEMDFRDGYLAIELENKESIVISLDLLSGWSEKF